MTHTARASTLLATLATLIACDDGSTAGPSGATPPITRCKLAAAAAVSLPADDARHDAPGEWFYWTGHLQTTSGDWIGFQLTVLAVGAPGNGLVLVHQSITDQANGTYDHTILAGLDDRDPDAGFDFIVGNVVARGVDGRDHLELVLAGGARLTLDLDDPRGPVARHGDGFKDYGAGVSTYYYSRPRMHARGTLQRGRLIDDVSGDVWFDHQWGALAPGTASYWDWIAVQLDDGSELMVTRFPLPGDTHIGIAELTSRDCVTTEIVTPDVSLAARGEWKSPATTCTYPSGWDLVVGDLELALDPVTLDQEMADDVGSYWEGATLVSGDTTGRAYVELVGYCARLSDP